MYALQANPMPIATERLPKALRMAGRFALTLMGFAPVIGAVISLRFALYEYGHGDSGLVRRLLDAPVADPVQTSR
jgi:hypothetical protein